MRPRTQGGMAFPDFLAAQLVTAAWWLHPDRTNLSTVLVATVVGSLEILQFLIYWGPRAPYPLTPSMLTTLRAWRAGLVIEKCKKSEVSPNAPIWKNPSLPHIYKILDPYAWTKYGVKLMSRIVSQDSLFPLSYLSSIYNIPDYYRFRYRYLQLSHAFAAQFPRSSCVPAQSELERTTKK